jgi:hypothetical protein
MKRLTILSLCAASLCCVTGCLFVRHSTSMVRDKEPLLPIRFESDRAKQYFLSGVHDLQSHKEGSDIQICAVPFLWWYSSASELSDNAIYNDQISVCDSNGDGLITTDEAMAFRAKVTEQLAVQKAKKQEPISSADSHAKQAETPPALIDLSPKAEK